MKPFPQCLEDIPPLWELDRFVAVNPFVGHLDKTFATAMEELEARTGTPHVITGVPSNLPTSSWTPDTPATLVGPFLASYYGSSTALVPPPWEHLPLFEAWKSSLPGSSGLDRKRSKLLTKLVSSLPNDPSEALATLLHPLELSSVAGGYQLSLWLDLLPGWASYLRKLEWPRAPRSGGDLAALGAILGALVQVCPEIQKPTSVPPPGLSERILLLEKEEALFRQTLRGKINPLVAEKKDLRVRAAFCIDVRSEPLRRAWELSDPRVGTDGFAGFFGMPLGWQGEGSIPHVPILLKPADYLKSPRPSKNKSTKLSTSGTPNFALVELTGWWDFAKYLGRIKPKAQINNYSGVEEAVLKIDLEKRTLWAEGLLNKLGWTHRWTPLMILVGHGSSSINNAHKSSLDCGACGGQTGEVSARAGAAILNDPQTRKALVAKGIQIPDGTIFVGALHNTNLDQIEFFQDRLPVQALEDLNDLKPGLEIAQKKAREEKNIRFPFLEANPEKRSKNEAETRPETGLSGNGAFLIAPPSVTGTQNWEGRAFLHSYYPEEDTNGSILEMILTAPVVVASWINLQYWAATNIPSIYGGGDKVILSRIGKIGVFEGGVADLKPGLPLQSVSFQGRPYHQTLRLQVMITAPLARVEEILNRNREVKRLFDGEWMSLSVYDKSSGWKRRAKGQWLEE